MRIGTLAERTGVSRRLLRYYEDQSLLSPRRTSSGYRQYTDADVARVGWIRAFLAAGLRTRTIAGLLPCLVEENGRTVATCPEMGSRQERERSRIARDIAALQSSRRRLDTLAASLRMPRRDDNGPRGPRDGGLTLGRGRTQ